MTNDHMPCSDEMSCSDEAACRPDLHLDFPARVRAGRAVLGWSQCELGERTHLSQRAIHRIEQAAVRVRAATMAAIETAFTRAGLRFHDLPDGGFSIAVSRNVLESAPPSPPARRSRHAEPPGSHLG